MRRVGSGLAAVVFVPAVLVMGILRSIAGARPVASKRRRGRWIEREPLAGAAARHRWRERPAGRAGAGAQARLAVLVALVLVGVGVGVGDLRRTVDDVAYVVGNSGEPTPDAARRLAAEPWFADLDAAGSASLSSDPFGQYAGVQMADVQSEVLTSVGGVRRSWRPPVAAEAANSSSSCRPLVVWAFGGSALYGLGQRDVHTIPSTLAKVAWRHGIALEIENFAVPGDTAWNENERLRYVLRTRPAPDLVVFYDGANEVRGVTWPYASGYDVSHRFNALFDRDWLPAVSRLRPDPDDPSRLVVDAPDTDVRDPDPEAVADAAVGQFRAAHDLRRTVLDGARLPFVEFIQPWTATRDPLRVGDGLTTVDQREAATEFRRRLPRGVVDLGNSLDRFPEAVFTDDVHTLESANPTIVARMWGPIERLIRDRVGECPR